MFSFGRSVGAIMERSRCIGLAADRNGAIAKLIGVFLNFYDGFPKISACIGMRDDGIVCNACRQ
jgi:hypothetical protein